MAKLPNLIFGLGTGRCGTKSLAHLLNRQLDTIASHEGLYLPWTKNTRLFFRHILNIYQSCESAMFCNVGFYWLQYVSEIMSLILDPKCICLERPKEEVVESFDTHTPEWNFWTAPESRHWDSSLWDYVSLMQHFPKYNLPKRDAIAQYWDEYHFASTFWRDKFPGNFMLIPMYEALNTEEGQRKILSFVGIDHKRQVLDIGVKLNTRKE